MKNILITGASGFIGSSIATEASKRGYNTWACIRQSSSTKYIDTQRINLLILKLEDKDRLVEQFQDFMALNGNIDYIIHTAGITKAADPKLFDEVNFKYTANLIVALKESGAAIHKFIFISSLSVMGKGDEINFTPIDIADETKPNTAYGRSKLKAEMYLQNKDYFPYIILRPTGVYGPRELDYFQMVSLVDKGLGLCVGKVPQQLSFLYVDDLVEAVFLAVATNVENKTYLVSDGKCYYDYEYISILQHALSKKRIIRIRVPLFLLKFGSSIGYIFSKMTGKSFLLNKDKVKIMEQRNWRCHISPIANDLNFVAKHDLEQGIASSVEWYRNNNWLQ